MRRDKKKRAESLKGGMVENDLAYDVGAFNGDDTAHYIQLGYRVISIEASPSLASKLQQRFCHEIQSGQCKIVNVAVGEVEGRLPFYVCDGIEELNSFDRSRIEGVGLKAREISVPVRQFVSLLTEYGSPHFIKVDIEGADRHAVLPLTQETAPAFLSFEAGKKDLDVILHLYGIGYRRFNLIRQDIRSSIGLPRVGDLRYVGWSARQWIRLALRRRPGLHGALRSIRQLSERMVARTSENVLDSGMTPMEQKDGWRDIETMLADWSSLVHSGLIETAWYDIHAALNA